MGSCPPTIRAAGLARPSAGVMFLPSLGPVMAPWYPPRSLPPRPLPPLRFDPRSLPPLAGPSPVFGPRSPLLPAPLPLLSRPLPLRLSCTVSPLPMVGLVINCPDVADIVEMGAISDTCADFDTQSPLAQLLLYFLVT